MHRVKDIIDPNNNSGQANLWSVSYSDVVSLLLVFFIILISSSSINNKKAEQITKAMKGDYTSKTTIENVKKKIDELVTEAQLENELTVVEDSLGVLIVINDKLLFNSGKAEINTGGKKLFEPLFEVFRKLPDHYRFEIEGHTDDVPIHNEQFPSNWYLSSARALSVLEIFIQKGFLENRLSIQGFADQRPLHPNKDDQGKAIPENRSKNRRVVIKVR